MQLQPSPTHHPSECSVVGDSHIRLQNTGERLCWWEALTPVGFAAPLIANERWKWCPDILCFNGACEGNSVQIATVPPNAMLQAMAARIGECDLTTIQTLTHSNIASPHPSFGTERSATLDIAIATA